MFTSLKYGLHFHLSDQEFVEYERDDGQYLIEKERPQNKELPEGRLEAGVATALELCFGQLESELNDPNGACYLPSK